MPVKILFRGSLAEEGELEIAKEFLPVIGSRVVAQPGDLIVGRYSVLPYYRELVADLGVHQATLINDYRAHRYVADLQNWYGDLEDVTPQTWFRVEDVPRFEPGPFILKGETNSRKSNWRTHMFAFDHAAITAVLLRLLDDTFIGGQQKIYVRKFEPMVTYGEGISGLPISKEFRFFVCDGVIIGQGFYWSEHVEEIQAPSPDEVPQAFLDKVIAAVGQNIRFWVMDVGQKLNGDWMVVELNDGQMSGLSCVNPHQLYANLREVLKSWEERHS